MLPLSSSPVVRVFGGRGFQIRFENGCTASVMFGPTNYCDRRSFDGLAGNTEQHESGNAEVAAWGPAGEWLIDAAEHGDNVAGWVEPDRVAAFIDAVRQHRIGQPFRFRFR